MKNYELINELSKFPAGQEVIVEVVFLNQKAEDLENGYSAVKQYTGHVNRDDQEITIVAYEENV